MPISSKVLAPRPAPGPKLHYDVGEPSRLNHHPIDLFLPRLEGVQPRGPGCYVARCPVPGHHDTTPSLVIRETADGTLLIKDFGGCTVAAIVAAVGLELRDLFLRRDEVDYDRSRRLRPPPLPWRDAIKALRHHLTVVQVGAARLAAGDDLSESDLDALGLAALHVSEMVEAAA